MSKNYFNEKLQHCYLLFQILDQPCAESFRMALEKEGYTSIWN